MGGGLQELVRLRIGGEQRLDLGAQLGVAGAGLADQGVALHRRPGEGRVQDFLDLLPAVGGHVPSWCRAYARRRPTSTHADTVRPWLPRRHIEAGARRPGRAR